MRIEYQDEIQQTPEKVFPWISEPEKAMQWQKNVIGGEIIISKPEIIGTTFREVIEENGKSLEMLGIITKYVKNEIMGFHLESKIHEFDISYTIEAIGRTTRLSIKADIKWKFPLNIFSKFIGKKMADELKKQLESEVQDLKKLCENT